MKKFLLVLSALLLSVSMASATMHCVAGMVVTGPAPTATECELGPLTFSMFQELNYNHPISLGVGTGVVGNVAYLSFFYAPPTPINDIHLVYKVEGPSTGIDTSFVSGTMIEVACTQQCPAGVILATINQGPGTYVEMFGSVQNTVWIDKDAAGMSHFTNSHHFNAVPEPGTYALMGAGLLAIGFLRRKA